MVNGELEFSSEFIELSNYFKRNNIDFKYSEIEILNNLFIKSLNNHKLKQDEKEINQYISLVKNNKLLLLSFIISLIQSIKIKIPTYQYIVEQVFVCQKDIVLNLTDIIICYYLDSNKELRIDFNLIELNQYINIIFKLPDLVSNVLSKTYINKDNYYLDLFFSIIDKEILGIKEISNYFLDKIVLLYLKYFVRTLITNDFSHKKIEDVIQLFELNFHRNDLIKEIFKFNFEKIENLEKIKEIFNVFELDINKTDLSKIKLDIIKLMRNNSNFSVLIIEVLKNLKGSELKVIIENLIKESIFNKKIVLGVDPITFYLLHFTLIMINYDSNSIENSMKNIENSMNSSLLNFENSDETKKKISLCFYSYIKENLKYINPSFNTEDINKINLISDLVNEEELEILDFQRNIKQYQKNIFFIVSEFVQEFKKKILKISQNNNFETKNVANSDLQKSIKEKTKYKSINLQKKHGVFKKNEIVISSKIKDEEIDEDDFEIKESKIKIGLKKNDDYDDLINLKNPIYLKDLILGLLSESKERLVLSLNSCEILIRKNLEDLEFCCEELSNVLLKLDNKFDIENFDEIIIKCLVALTVKVPENMAQILANRFFDQGSGLRQKFDILKIIEISIEEISQFNLKHTHQNPLHKLNEKFVFPLLNYIRGSKLDSLIAFKEYYSLLARFFYVISKIIKFSVNSPKIYKILFESLSFFQSIKNINDIVIIDSINFYCGVIKKFFNKNFLEIYPEIIFNFKEILEYLQNKFSEVVNEELRTEIARNLNNYLILMSSDQTNHEENSLLIINN